MGDLEPKGDFAALLVKFGIRATLAAQLSEVVAPTLVDLVTQYIPSRRTENIKELLVKIQERLDRLDPPAIPDQVYSPTFVGLLEDGMAQAARASRERIELIAELLTRGISESEARRVDQRHLLQLLGELNDVEVILLIASTLDGVDADRFYRRHEAVLAPPADGGRLSQEEYDRIAMYESHRFHLERLRLVEFTERKRQFGAPLPTTLTVRGGVMKATPLGRLLVRSIGHSAPTPDEPVVRAGKISPEHLDRVWEAVSASMMQLVNEVQQTAGRKNARLRMTRQGINYSVVLETAHAESRQLSGFVSHRDGWIWREFGADKLLILVGEDSDGAFWQEDNKRRTSLPMLARYILSPIMVELDSLPDPHIP